HSAGRGYVQLQSAVTLNARLAALPLPSRVSLVAPPMVAAGRWIGMRVAAVCLLALTFLGSAAIAAECPGNPNALGTSRTIAVDPTEHARIGSMQYRETLPLEEGEVVLTFDDGPLPPYTNRILDILASECVKATYFLVGRMAQAHPDM